MLVEQINPSEYVADNMTAKFTAWNKHCCSFYNELVELLVDQKYILAKDILKASALVTDIQIRSTAVPFDNKIEDMSNDLYHWISLSIRGNKLKELFLPLE